jgi:imidazolonepropionase-like amidohydrolase
MKTLIRGVRIIDGLHDTVVESGAVLFDETGILQVEHQADAGLDADVVIDGSGMTLLPGLMDCHVHLGMDCSPDPFRSMLFDTEATIALRAHQQGLAFLAHGITTVRNLGTRFNADISYRNAVEDGLIEGPRVYASGKPIVMTGGHGHVFAHEVDGVDEVRKAARAQLKAGADLLKVMATGGVLTKGTEPGATQLSEAELRCACQEAANASKTTACHAIGLEGIKNAIRAGVTTIEHGSYLDEEAIQLMKERGTYLVPTLIAATCIVNHSTEDGLSEDMLRKANSFLLEHRANFRKAVQAGVKIVAGTDAGTPFNFPGYLAEELQLMIEGGMTPMAAIQSATRISAECLNIAEQTGTVEVGKWADLLLVEGNPLEDILCLKNVRQVYKGGKLCVDRLGTVQKAMIR